MDRTEREFNANANRFIDEKRMTFQHNEGLAQYHQIIGSVECRCIIGAAMTDEEIAKITHYGANDIGLLGIKEFLKGRERIDEIDDLLRHTETQMMHDYLCRKSAQQYGFQKAVKEMYEAIDRPLSRLSDDLSLRTR